MINETLQIIVGIVTLIATVGGFLSWHFNTIHRVKDQIQELKLEMKELEKQDELQQQTIDQLKELYPVLRTVIENLNKGKK